MGTRLRLAAAGLTDVGRRRERNQDNTTHNVPTDEQVLAEKGALFVVCDGMGGHAAGEVASEIGVNTIRDEYYASSHPDIISGIAHAIKTANERIFNYAREHAEMTGMGTTCVTLVIHGGRAYIVNIGDSRAYLFRGDSMRQITMDHSWVAEQVRAGVLTDEQARTHAHRNVITRSLGTQPTVNADLFVETLQDGDRLLLCSDGLHGYVDEQEIEREVLRGDDPERSVRTLVDMANDNGGPDNITAVVVHMLEVPPVTGEVTLPNMEEQGITQPIPAVAAPTRPAARTPSEPAALTAEKRPARRRRSGGARVALAAVRLLAVAAIILLGVGIWDFTAGPYGAARAATDRARADIAAAHQAAQAAPGQDPQLALTALTAAQKRLVADTQSAQLDDQTRADAQAALTNDVTPAVRDALQRYNAAALITPVPLGSLHTYPASCQQPASAGGSVSLADVTSFAALSPQLKPGDPTPSSQTLYAVSGGAIFQITTPLDDTSDGVVAPGAMTCAAVSLPGAPAVIAVAADGTSLYALAQHGTGFAVLAVTPSGPAPDGTVSAKADVRATVPVAAGETPTAFAAAGGAWYIAYTGGDAGSAGIWVFSGQTPKQPSATVALQQPAVSITVGGGTIYAMLADGSIGTAGSDHTFRPLPITLPPPLLKGDPSDFTAATPVPTPAAGSAAATSGPFGAGATVAVNPRSPDELLIGDGTNSRVARLTTAPAAASVTPSAQYVYGPPVEHAKLFAVAANATGLNFYVWNDGNVVGFSQPASGA